MALDDDKRDLGKISMKQPAAFGRIKQKALDLGMSTEEFILSHDPDKDVKRNTPDSSTELTEIKKTLAELTNKINAAPAPQQDMFSQMTAMATFITSIKGMFPQTSVSDVVKQISSLREAENAIFENSQGGEEEGPESYLIKTLGKKLLESPGFGMKQPMGPAGEVTHQAAPPIPEAGGKPVDSKLHPAGEAGKVGQSLPVSTPPSSDIIESNIKGEPMAAQIASKGQTPEEVPDVVKKAIKNGTMTLQNAKHLAKVEMEKRGLPFDEELIEKQFKEIQES